MFSRFYPVTAALLRRTPFAAPELGALPAETVAPAETLWSPPVFFDPADWDRVTAVQHETTPEVERSRIGGGWRKHGPTLRYRFRNVLATPQGFFGLNGGYVRLGRVRAAGLAAPETALDSGYYALNSMARKYFGHWLLDGLPATLLREGDEPMFMPDFGNSWHARAYHHLLGFEAMAEKRVFFRKLSFCDDRGQNSHRNARLSAIHARLAARLHPAGHPGVFIRRGAAGAARLMVNENELADALAARGFAVCHANDPLDGILAASAGVGVVVSMEGSQMVHGLLAARRGALNVVINPADRFNNVLADFMPSLGHRMAAIVAARDGEGYRVDVARLLHLMDSSLDRMAGA